MIVLDTNTVLHLIAGQLADRFDNEEIVVSVITEMELLGYPAITDQEQDVLAKFIESIHIAELHGDLKQIAIRVRREHRLKLPDAIIAATALYLDAPLYTLDRHFDRVVGLDLRRPTGI